LQIPRSVTGSLFPVALEPRKRSERALVSVVQQAYVCGVSTRCVDQLVESLRLRISKSEVSRIAGLLDEQVQAFRQPPLEGRSRDRAPRDRRPRRRRSRDRGVLARVPAQPLSRAAGSGCRSPSATRTPGLKAALAQVLDAPWQGCTVHFLTDPSRPRAPGPVRRTRRRHPPDLHRQRRRGSALPTWRRGRPARAPAGKARRAARTSGRRRACLLRVPVNGRGRHLPRGRPPPVLGSRSVLSHSRAYSCVRPCLTNYRP